MARTILNWSLWILSPFSPFLSPTRLLHKSLIPLTRTTCPGSLLESSGIRSGSLVNNSNCTESTGLWQVATSIVKAGERRERQLLRDGPQRSWGVHTGRTCGEWSRAVCFLCNAVYTALRGPARVWTSVLWADNLGFISWKSSFVRRFMVSALKLSMSHLFTSPGTCSS